MAPLPNASSHSTMLSPPEVQHPNGQVSCGSPHSVDSITVVGGIGCRPDMSTTPIRITTNGTPGDPTSMPLVANLSTGSQPRYQHEDHGSARIGIVQPGKELCGHHGQNMSVEDIPLMQIEHQAGVAQQQTQESSVHCDLSNLRGKTILPESHLGDSSLTDSKPEGILLETEVRETHCHRCEEDNHQSGSGRGSSDGQQAEALRNHEAHIRLLSNGGREREERSAQLAPAASGDQAESCQSPELDLSELTQFGHTKRTGRGEDFGVSSHCSDGEENPSTLPSSELPLTKLLHVRKYSMSKFHEQLESYDEPCDGPKGRLQKWWEKLRCQVGCVRGRGSQKVGWTLQNKSLTKERIKGR